MNGLRAENPGALHDGGRQKGFRLPHLKLKGAQIREREGARFLIVQRDECSDAGNGEFFAHGAMEPPSTVRALSIRPGVAPAPCLIYSRLQRPSQETQTPL